MKFFRFLASLMFVVGMFCMVACSDDDDESSVPTASDDPAPVDLGLSVRWATCNVGASNPGGYGDYFAWGETSTKEDFSDENCATLGVEIRDFSGVPEFDAAAAVLGGGWRMPTAAELEELIENCEWKWDKYGDASGYTVTGSNGSSIFLPASGRYSGTVLGYVNMHGRYWTSTPAENNLENAVNLHFELGVCCAEDYLRGRGYTIRPVIEY